MVFLCTLDMRALHPLLAWPNRMKKELGQVGSQQVRFLGELPVLKGTDTSGRLNISEPGPSALPKGFKKGMLPDIGLILPENQVAWVLKKHIRCHWLGL